MGKIAQGILGGISGKVGNVIGANWKGIHYLRIKPVSVANPRTEGQVNQRNKFSAMVGFLTPIKSFLQQGFKFHQHRQTPQNAAMSYNIKNAVAGTAPDFMVDYAAALVSRGSLTGATGGIATADGLTINFSWTDNSAEGNARPDDQAMLLVYNETLKEAVALPDAAFPRTAEGGSLELPASYVGNTLHYYLAFKSADGSAVSNSVYLGSGTIV